MKPWRVTEKKALCTFCGQDTVGDPDDTGLMTVLNEGRPETGYFHAGCLTVWKQRHPTRWHCTECAAGLLWQQNPIQIVEILEGKPAPAALCRDCWQKASKRRR